MPSHRDTSYPMDERSKFPHDGSLLDYLQNTRACLWRELGRVPHAWWHRPSEDLESECGGRETDAHFQVVVRNTNGHLVRGKVMSAVASARDSAA